MSHIIASVYEIIGKLGAGGGGTVYLANHLRLGKKVVLKVDKRKITTSEKLLRREVDILKELSHTYIPQVYDFFVENNNAYTVIDFIEGESLNIPLKQGRRFSQPQVIKWAKQLLEAVAYLHSPTHGNPPRSFIHCDIKPANIMVRPNGDICLIDFNIAFALGEEDAAGCSIGYASPEHYGLDFSNDNSTDVLDSIQGVERKNTDILREDSKQILAKNGRKESKTVLLSNQVQESGTIFLSNQEQGKGTIPLSSNNLNLERNKKIVSDFSSYTSKRKVVPDTRSDIYCIGATLYHLLSGRRPAPNAKEVIPLSKEKFSPQIVKIITKAMDPNPDLRYQTAEEMLDEFVNIRENDPRMKALKRRNKIAFTVFPIFFAVGIFSAFTGLKRMQGMEQGLKLVEYSKNALEKGDSASAVSYGLQASMQKVGEHSAEYDAKVQRALSDALGVYDLSDGYKIYKTIELPSEPVYMTISPDGKTASCICNNSVVVFDTTTCEILITLPTEKTALSEVEYLNEKIIIYAGEDGITAYDIQNGKELWKGKKATALSISEDGNRVVAVYREETFATIYRTSDGKEEKTIDFGGKHLYIPSNDTIANTNDNLLELNENGTLLGVSFSDGILRVYNVEDGTEAAQIFNEKSGYTKFEGGFYKNYLAFSASSESNSGFAIVDMNTMEQTGGFESINSTYSAYTDEYGIYVQTDNIWQNINPENGEAKPLVNTKENIESYAKSGTHTMIATNKNFMFFDQNANLISTYKRKNNNFVQIAGETALVAGLDSATVQILNYENHSDTEVFTYDPLYEHSEVRISGDKETVMLFSDKKFYLYNMEGKKINEVAIPNSDQVYGQEYRKDEKESKLEVIYNDGSIITYSATTGKMISQEKGEVPEKEFYGQFETDKLRIKSGFHGAPEVYDLKTGELICKLSEDAELTDVIQVGQYMIIQYMTVDGYYYGQLLNENCEVMANFPYLCDVVGETLFFDYPTGNIRQSNIYDINELIKLAKNNK